ncbi:MAG TPA: hypothetical protein PLZ51_09035, partial [Aggregatilineales bacterium]|nr:hypothetical protein [Aggregatilineales bacterium]
MDFEIGMGIAIIIPMPNLPNSQKTNTSIQKSVRKIQPQIPLILVVIMAIALIGIAFWNARPKPAPIILTATT